MNLATDLLRREGDEDRPLLIEQDGTTFTYAQVADAARRVAGRLRLDGLVPGDRVLLLLPNGFDYLAAYYGVLIAGGIAVPLPPASTREYCVRVQQICQPRYAFASGARSTELLLRSGAERVQAVSSILSAAVDPMQGRVSRSPGDVAHVIFTSGTTGTPKGVALSHGAISSNTRGIVEYLRLGERDRVGVVLDFVYSYGNSLLQTHVHAGGSLALLGSVVFAQQVARRLADTACTGFSGVPSTYALLLRSGSLGERPLPALRYVTCAGGALPQQNLRRLRAALPHVEVFLMYGQTEASARLSYLPLDELERRPTSIGRGMPGTTLEVLREDGAPVDVGEEGEIVASGANLMNGYWGDPEATRQALRNGRLWTGDLGYRDSEGFIYITGRRSELIKTAAYRVHPKEIEEQIVGMSRVHECAVVGVPDAVLGEALVACFPAGTAPTLAEIRAHLRERLPDYKWPRFVVEVENIPRTTSGKVRRRELAQLADAVLDRMQITRTE